MPYRALKNNNSSNNMFASKNPDPALFNKISIPGEYSEEYQIQSGSAAKPSRSENAPFYGSDQVSVGGMHKLDAIKNKQRFSKQRDEELSNISDDEWGEIQRFAQVQYQEDLKKEKTQKKEKLLHVKQILDQ